MRLTVKMRKFVHLSMLLLVVSLACLVWLTAVVRRIMNAAAPEVARDIEERPAMARVTLRVLCPVHDVEARVQIVGTSGTPKDMLGGCSLHPDQAAGVPCEGRCIIPDDPPAVAETEEHYRSSEIDSNA